MSKESELESGGITPSKRSKCNIKSHFFNAAISMALGFATLAMGFAVGKVKGFEETGINVAIQSINSWNDYKAGRISYDTFSYVMGGRGTVAPYLDSIMLMAAQTEKGNFDARDRTLMNVLNGTNRTDMFFILGDKREIFDENYRDELNTKTKEQLSSKVYNRIVDLQKTNLKDVELNALKGCYEKLGSEHSVMNTMLDIVIPKDKQPCAEFIQAQDDSTLINDKHSN